MAKLFKRPKCIRIKGTEIRVKINNMLTNSIPSESFDIRGKIGTIVHSLDDGFNLIFFDKIVQRDIMLKNRTIKKKEFLQRYVHTNDLEIIKN